MSKNILTIIFITGMIACYIWMQLLLHKKPFPDDGGRSRYIHPVPQKGMLFKVPPIGSVVLGRWKNSYICKPISFEGAILISGGSGCGKSTSAVEPYIFNCNEKLRRILYGKKSIKLSRDSNRTSRK